MVGVIQLGGKVNKNSKLEETLRSLIVKYKIELKAIRKGIPLCRSAGYEYKTGQQEGKASVLNGIVFDLDFLLLKEAEMNISNKGDKNLIKKMIKLLKGKETK